MNQPEEWRAISDFPSYEVSEAGDVRRVKNGRLLRPFVCSGYPHLSIVNKDGERKRIAAHRLVAASFLPPKPSPKHEVAHNDGNRANPHPSNLRWATRRENCADRIEHGTLINGEKHSSAKLSLEKIAEAIDLHAAGASFAALGKRYGVNPSTIWRACTGRHWAVALQQSLRGLGGVAGARIDGDDE